MMQDLLQSYLKSRSRQVRLDCLQQLAVRAEKIPLQLAEDLLRVGISVDEKMKILENTDLTSKLEFEDFVTREFHAFQLPLATMALRTWAEHTNCLYWHRFIPFLKSNFLPQRLRYTLLEISEIFDPEYVVKLCIENPSLWEFSSVFHNLVIETCLKCHLNSSEVIKLSLTIFERSILETYPQDRSILPAVLYLKAFAPEKINQAVSKNSYLWTYAIDVIKKSKSKLVFPDFALKTKKDQSLTAEIKAEREDYLSSRQKVFASAHDKNSDIKQKNLSTLVESSRRNEGVFTVLYLEKLGSYKGQDEAVLKILDYIHTTEVDEQNAMINSLAKIGTTRAIQEIVACLTRKNVPLVMKLQCANVLQNLDVSNLQSELRNALNHFDAEVAANKVSQSDPMVAEVIEQIENILSPVFGGQASIPNSTSNLMHLSQLNQSDMNFDAELAKRLGTFNKLSDEVKRAFRTAQFFDQSVVSHAQRDNLDLSPLIDMQYKALELYFRETFEDKVHQVLQSGVLQRKLDVLGYGRPIPELMDRFESYLASLPTIAEIPFFSKFKLRKLLRSICQFQSGRRFTLDSLKAFGLFFLCFSRKNCPHHLENLVDLGFSSDKELFKFCSLLHVFQDHRNRAAHEGFHPDVKANPELLWSHCRDILNMTFTVTQNLKESKPERIAS